MLSGGIEEDVLQLNLDSLWSGDMNLERGARSMGRYQSLGELRILLEKAPRQPDFYRRELDLARALHTVVIKAGGTSLHQCSGSGFSLFHFLFTAADRPDRSGGLKAGDGVS